MTNAATSVNIRLSTQDPPTTVGLNARVVEALTPKQYGLVSLTVNGEKIPTTCFTGLYLVASESSVDPKSSQRQLYNDWRIIDDIVLQEDINKYRHRRGADTIEWVWHDD